MTRELARVRGNLEDARGFDVLMVREYMCIHSHLFYDFLMTGTSGIGPDIPLISEELPASCLGFVDAVNTGTPTTVYDRSVIWPYTRSCNQEPFDYHGTSKASSKTLASRPQCTLGANSDNNFDEDEESLTKKTVLTSAFFVLLYVTVYLMPKLNLHVFLTFRTTPSRRG